MGRTTSIAFPSRKFFRGLPVFGGLADARWRDHREAINEVGVNVLLSTLPIWLGAIFLFAAAKFQMPLGEVIGRNIENGELFLYATAIVAPMYYFIFKDQEGDRKFPNAASFMTLSAVILAVGVCGFAETRLSTVLGISFHWDERTLLNISLPLYLFSTGLVYLAHVYRNWRESGGAAVFTLQTQDLVTSFIDGPKT